MTPVKLVKSALTPPLAAISAVIFAALGADAVPRPEDAVDLTTDDTSKVSSTTKDFTTGPDRAFNDKKKLNDGTYRICMSKKPFDIIYTFDAPTVVNAYGIQAASGSNGQKRAPKSWELYGAIGADGDWVRIDTRSSETDWGAEGEYRYYTFDNFEPYTRYKIIFKSDNGGGYVQFAYMEYFFNPVASINVTGFPARYGTPNPGYGAMLDPVVGETYEFNPPEGSVDEAGTTRFHCTDWELLSSTGTVLSCGTDKATVRYSEPATLVWKFTREFKVSVVCDSTKGEVVQEEEWYAEGETAAVKVISAAGSTFVGVTGDVQVSAEGGDTVSFAVTGPTEVTALFNPYRCVTESGDDSKDGCTPDTAFATLMKAVASIAEAGGDMGTVYVGEGTFFVPNNDATRVADAKGGLILDRAIRILGAGPEKTIVTLEPSATYGRVFYLNHAEALVAGLTVTGGKAFSMRGIAGSGVMIDTAGGTVSNVVIRGNVFTATNQDGGAVAVSGTKSLLTHSVVSNNGYTTARSVGEKAGGVYVTGGTVANCLITGNSGRFGGGIGVAGAAKVLNCTVAFNQSIRDNDGALDGGQSGGILTSGAAFSVVNTIFCGNKAENPTGSAGGEEYEAPADPTAFNACFASCGFGNATGVTPAGEGAKQLGADCFRDSASGDFTLARGSAAIDGGTVYTGIAAKDLAGNDRVIGERPDIGCYEFDTTAFACGIEVSDEALFQGGTVTFTANVYGVGEGDEVTYAWTLKDADGAEVATSSARVFDYPTEAPGALSAYLTVTAEGKGECSDERLQAVMVRSRDLFVVEANENAREPYESWEHAGTNLVDMLTYAVDGQTIHIGEGTFLGPHSTAGAAFSVTKSLEVVGAGPERTILTLESSTSTKGRVLLLANRNARVSGLTITGGCGVSSGTGAAMSGSGVLIDTSGGTVSNVVIRDNRFTNFGSVGGAIGLRGQYALLTHSVVSNNGYSCARPAGAVGSGVYIDGGTVANCLITGNSGRFGGGIGVAGSAKVRNCTVAFNRADRDNAGAAKEGGKGGGIYTADTSPAFSVVNTVFCGDWAENPTGSAEYEAPASPATFNARFSHCGFTAADAAGEGSLSVDDVASVRFKDVEHGNFALSHQSPFYKKGVYQSWMDGATDLAGNDRLVKSRKGTWLVDMGCYESPWFGPGLMLMVR